LILNHTHSFVRNNRNSVLIHCKLNLLSSLNKFHCFSSKPNIPFYTGKSHWTKVDPISHYDQSGQAYTTTAAFYKYRIEFFLLSCH
jgi:hypothetical protein